jgi:hypothetical protein
MPYIFTFVNQLENLKSSTIRKNSNRSINWVSNKIRNTPDDLKKLKPSGGEMYLFMYKPKWENQLNYYDRIPLILVLNYNNSYILGLNFHYLPPKLRQKFLNELSNRFKRGDDENAIIKASYETVKKMRIKFYKPTIKLYLINQVKSPLIKIPAKEWNMAIDLPIANFAGSSANTVYFESRQQLR